jgi:hypothetical protein
MAAHGCAAEPISSLGRRRSFRQWRTPGAIGESGPWLAALIRGRFETSPVRRVGTGPLDSTAGLSSPWLGSILRSPLAEGEAYRCERSTVPRSCSGLIADGWLSARTASGNAIRRHPSASILPWSPVILRGFCVRTTVSAAICRFTAAPEFRCSTERGRRFCAAGFVFQWCAPPAYDRNTSGR